MACMLFFYKCHGLRVCCVPVPTRMNPQVISVNDSLSDDHGGCSYCMLNFGLIEAILTELHYSRYRRPKGHCDTCGSFEEPHRWKNCFLVIISAL